jgi:hypothetical protein
MHPYLRQSAAQAQIDELRRSAREHRTALHSSRGRRGLFARLRLAQMPLSAIRADVTSITPADAYN